MFFGSCFCVMVVLLMELKKYFNQDNLFYVISALLILVICVFQNWLYWPGYIQDDSQTTLLLDKSGWHPAIMAYLVEILHNLLGVHIGLYIIVYSAYKKTNSLFSIFLIFPIFIGNVYYSIIKMGSSSFSISWSLLLYAMSFYMIVQFGKEKISKIFYVLYGIVFAIALLSRLNAILHIWPVTFIWIAMLLSTEEYSFWGYVKRFIPLAIFSGFFCVILFIGLNSILTKSDKGHVYPETLVVMHQIVAICAPEMDESCFNPDWWYGKWATDPDRMKHLKEKYKYYKQDAEAFSLSYTADPTFKFFTNLEGRYSKFFYALRKYPKNYIEHVHFFYIDLWQFPPNFITPQAFKRKYTVKKMLRQIYIFHPISERERSYFLSIANQIPDKERSLFWNDTKEGIDYAVRENILAFSLSVFVKICFAMFFMGLLLFSIKRRNLLNAFLFSVSSAGILNWVIIPLFCPRLFIRYIEPAIICSVLALGVFLIILYQNMPGVYVYIKNKIKPVSEKTNDTQY